MHQVQPEQVRPCHLSGGLPGASLRSDIVCADNVHLLLFLVDCSMTEDDLEVLRRRRAPSGWDNA